MQEYVFSVSEYIELINETLKQRKINIQGEITSFSARGGAVFFTIADTEEEAILECVVWKSVYENLGIELEEGMEVRISGTASIYAKNGRFRFIAYSIVPLGEGALRKAFEKLKQKLEDAGYFDKERKRKLPDYIKNIGLITADKSDAKKDFETHVGKNGLKIYFHDAKVEGTNAIRDIVRAFDYFNESTLDLDVIVLTRGGGSLESLMAFNSEDIAKAIYKSRIPVISAIGHENDISISDLVADVRASTPTHAGKIIAQPYVELENLVVLGERDLITTFSENIKVIKEILKDQAGDIFYNFENIISKQKAGILMAQKTQTMALSGVITGYRNLENTFLNSLNFYQHNISSNKNRLNYAEELLKTNDPKHKLKQGYSITMTKDKKIIRSNKDVKHGDILTTKLFEGEINSTVG